MQRPHSVAAGLSDQLLLQGAQPSPAATRRVRATGFAPHDPRETSSRFHAPVPRQVWVMGKSGLQFSSADAERRGMPPYLLVMDLVFAATCATASDLIGNSSELLGVSVLRFFMLLISLMWIWMTINRELNAFDPEDISFELLIFGLAAGMMAITFSLKSCFLHHDPFGVGSCWNATFSTLAHACAADDRAACDDLTALANRTSRCFEDGADDHRSIVPSHDAAGRASNSCFDFLAAFASVRLLLLLLYAYVALHVALVRRVKLSYACASLGVWAAALGAAFHLCAYSPPEAPHPRLVLELLLFGATASDMALHFGPHLLCAPARCLPNALAVPQSIAYTETRYQRFVVISIGNVVANCARNEASLRGALSLRVAASTWFGVPLVAFLLKIFYFDLSPHYGGSALTSHAMRISLPRSVAWQLLHLLLFGSVLWISKAAPDLVVRSGETAAELLAAAEDPGGVRVSAGAPCADNAVSFGAALVSYVLCVTLVQLLHRGQGRGQRKLGKTRRLALRLVFVALLVGLTLFAVATAMDTHAYFWLAAALMATDVAIELWGRGFSCARPMPAEDPNAASSSPTPRRWDLASRPCSPPAPDEPSVPSVRVPSPLPSTPPPTSAKAQQHVNELSDVNGELDGGHSLLFSTPEPINGRGRTRSLPACDLLILPTDGAG